MHEALIKKYLPIVHSAAWRYHRATTIPLEDLVAEGSYALALAAHRFDPSRGHFGRYAKIYVTGFIRNYISHNRWELKISRSASNFYNKLSSIKGCHPDKTPMWYAEKMGLTLAEFDRLNAESSVSSESYCDQGEYTDNPTDYSQLTDLPLPVYEVLEDVFCRKINAYRACRKHGVSIEEFHKAALDIKSGCTNGF